MTIYSGDEFKVKIEINGKFENIGGIYDSKFFLTNQYIKSNSISNNIFQKLYKCKVSTLNFSISGIYTATVAEEQIKHLAFHGLAGTYQLYFEGNHSLITKLNITSYERIGNIGSEEKYNIDFESSGELLML